MKQLILLTFFATLGFSLKAQLVPCRHKICMICYTYHDDRGANAAMDSIRAMRPDILIDNTPGGFWGEVNSGIGCLPYRYTPLGIKVFSYITGGYEGTRRDGDTANIDSNLARINAIANDSATGVFLDEVSYNPDAAGKIYIDSIFRRCRAKGLKLILNTGVYTSLDTSFLMHHCDYLLTDENYHGRAPSGYELPYLDSILIVSQHIATPTRADSISDSSQINGFQYYYACDLYIHLPAWLRIYTNLITHPPVAAMTISGATATRAFTYSGTSVSLDSVVWNFGDGGHSTALTASHTYAMADTYNVCVTAYSPCGSDSSCVSLIIPCYVPVASFTHSGSSTTHFSYTGTTTFVDSIVWFFGDGYRAAGNSLSHTYSTPGTYRACVIAYSPCANDTTCSYIHITGLDVNSYTLSKMEVFPNPVTDELFITGVPEQISYRLLNVAGKTLQQGLFEGGSNSLSVKNYTPGIYVLEVTGMDGQRNMVKVVKE